ncbi:MAG: hypothetical protein LBH28_06725 [Oscillospiraceae bacterium]|jgi:hypothetical protein|nr:hypothetical protein [Oscillospiraceae bacterium]
MDIKYYGFALFIAILVCLVAVLCRALFGGIKRQLKLFDEKESQFMALYRSIESIMEEWNDQVKASKDEIKEFENHASVRLASIIAQMAPGKEEADHKPLQFAAAGPDRIGSAGEVLARAEKMAKQSTGIRPDASKKNDRGTVFRRLFDERIGELSTGSDDTPAKPSKNDSILALAEDGKTVPQIARELGITQNEVNLVIGIMGMKSS